MIFLKYNLQIGSFTIYCSQAFFNILTLKKTHKSVFTLHFICSESVCSCLNFFTGRYVALSYPGSMQFSHIIKESPRDLLWNVVLKIFHKQNIHHHVWNTVRTTWQSTVGHQWRGEDHEMEKNCGTNLSHSFPCFSNILPRIGEQQNIKVWFWEFSTHDDIYFVCGKLSKLHFDA